jgi:hypothetical protein
MQDAAGGNGGVPDIECNLGPMRRSDNMLVILPTVFVMVIKVRAAAAAMGRGSPVSRSGGGCMQQSRGIIGNLDLGRRGGHGTKIPWEALSFLESSTASVSRPRSYSNWAAGGRDG